MVGGNSKTGRYMNPNVATTVVGGTIYDKNDRILAMDVPVYNLYINKNYSDSDIISQVLSIHLNMTPDEIESKINKLVQENTTLDTNILVIENIDSEKISELEMNLKEQSLEGFVTIKKQYQRTYPTAFHSSQLIQQIESVYKEELFPIPEYDVSTTYGKDIHLSIDLDIQYLLDLVAQQVYEIQNPQYVLAGIIDIKTAKMNACTTYPFYDLNTAAINNNENLALPKSITNESQIIENISVIDCLTDHKTGEIIEDSTNKQDSLFTQWQELEKMLSNTDGTTSTIALLPSSNPQYAVFICSYQPKYYINSSVLDDALQSLEEGLVSQGRISFTN